MNDSPKTDRLLQRLIQIDVWTLKPLAACLIICVASLADADDVRITPIENWSTAFAGDEVKVGHRVTSDKSTDGTLRWSHSANQRTIARGEVELQPSGDASATAEFLLRPVELHDGVIFATTIRTEFVPRGKTTPVASQERTLWLFPRSPLIGKAEWAKALDIELFDPAGITAKRFDDMKLPYRSVHNVAVLNDPQQHGVLIIGEGVSLLRNRSLAETILQAAAAGRRVILLAPSDGSLPVPGTEGDGLPEGVVPGELRFAREHIIAEFDKRFDVVAWQGTDHTIPSSRFFIESRSSRVEAVVTEQSSAWPWLEVRFPNNRGVLLVCGFQVIQYSDHGPTPGYLLIRILESLCEPGP